MQPDNSLIKSLGQLRESFARRGHELDPVERQNLLDALHQLYTATENLNCRLHALTPQAPERNHPRSVLFLVK
jgi:hypothetical protein